jgi:hypothetical protein
VDGESTLLRLPDSMCQMVGPPFTVLVLTTTVHPDLEQAAEQQVSLTAVEFATSSDVENMAGTIR